MNKIQKPKLSESDVRENHSFDDHEMVISLTDSRSGLVAYVGIHNTNLGPALGGTRFISYQNGEDAVSDVLNLSKAMSYKCALAGLPFGGGKGVILEPGSYSRDELLSAYARLIDKLRGLFKTGTDVGLSENDIKKMAKYSSHMLGVVDAERGDLTTSSCAAKGTFYSIQAVSNHLYSTKDLTGKSIAIKGIGKLGGELAALTVEAGAKVIVSDIDNKKCQDLKGRLQNIEVVDNEEISNLEVDFFSPCALGNEINESSVATLRCKAVVGGANNQLSSSRVGNLLHQANIIYAPDYIVNSGGLIYVADELEDGGFKKERVESRLKAIYDTIEEILKRSKVNGEPMYKIADQLAIERMYRV